MLAPMRALDVGRFGLAAAVVLATVPADGWARPGRIVRVERPRTGSKGSLRVCQYNGDVNVMCFGAPPRAGESGTLVTEAQSGAISGVRGTVKVKLVEPSNPGVGGTTSPCAAGLWRAELEPDGARVDGYTSNTWVVFDGALGAEARLVQPPQELPAKVPGETAPVTIDRDGDNIADYLVTWYQSDTNVSGSTRYTVDFWQGEHRRHDDEVRWRRLRQDVVSWCN
jgi:hypothetical protein